MKFLKQMHFFVDVIKNDQFKLKKNNFRSKNSSNQKAPILNKNMISRQIARFLVKRPYFRPQGPF